MSGEYWARQADWYQRRYSPSRHLQEGNCIDNPLSMPFSPHVARMAEAFKANMADIRFDDTWTICGRCGAHFPTRSTCSNHRYDTPTPPTKDPMNDSTKLAYHLQLSTWRTVQFLVNGGHTQTLKEVCEANVEVLTEVLEIPNTPEKD